MADHRELDLALRGVQDSDEHHEPAVRVPVPYGFDRSRLPGQLADASGQPLHIPRGIGLPDDSVSQGLIASHHHALAVVQARMRSLGAIL
ncbi:hypothetical protein [Streptomyces sp. NBC_00576]|uniref:hypothetical protein n=1 Tax=Streptomyces sp. NBC_00576 TaxID=2903665 RepID=UPI002E811F57|nr:hypothetical protein [Streptomyces sp. NBC_00576]WUB72010.1 hypothetical protein OG734_18920 [Streptomyces sp. NBC_00576]